MSIEAFALADRIDPTNDDDEVNLDIQMLQ